MSVNISPNRSALLQIKKKIALAKKGQSLLKKKQDVLIGKLFVYVHELQKKQTEFNIKQNKLHADFVHTLALTGNFVARSASYGSPDQFLVKSVPESIMGVSVPKFELISSGKPYLYESPLLIESAKLHVHLIQDILELAQLEISIRTIADEIKKTKRRVNSLEHIQIPRLQQILSAIRLTLEEQERESFIRLKHIKNTLHM